MSKQLREAAPPTRAARQRGGQADGSTAVDELRSQLRKITTLAVAIVTVLGIAGVALIIADDSWALVVAVAVVVMSLVVVLLAVAKGDAAARELRHFLRVTAASAAEREQQVRQAYQPSPAPRADTGAHQLPQAPRPSGTQAVRSMLEHDSDQGREVFVKLARRLQSLINRAIKRVDELEREMEDPDLLRGVYEIDHLATRVRRQAENLAVLGGEAPQRRSSKPVSANAVLRSAVAEVEHYKQISIVPVEGIELNGHAVAEIIHLLAELLENATTFTAPDSPKVVLRAQKVTAGLAIEVQDRGLGMTTEDLVRINRLLDGSTQIDIAELLQDGRIGLAVVKELSRRHNVRVRLQTNIFGGIDAAVVLPHNLIADEAEPAAAPKARRAAEPQAPAVPAAQSAPPSAVTATLPPVPPVPSLSPEPPAPAQPVQPVQPLSAPLPSRKGAVYAAAGDIADPGTGWEELAPPSAAPARHELPPLPTRDPGTTFNAAVRAAAASDDPAEETGPPEPEAAQGQQTPPPLPQRRGHSHLRQELHDPPTPTRPIPGHDTNLMASVQQGINRAQDEHDNGAETDHSQHGSTQGASISWPMT
ncbi:ATP-binding protein [Saccharomonospora sp. NPDC006951]